MDEFFDGSGFIPFDSTPEFDFDYSVLPALSEDEIGQILADSGASGSSNFVGNLLKDLGTKAGSGVLNQLLSGAGGFVNENPLTSLLGGAGVTALLYQALQGNKQQPGYTSNLAQTQAAPYQHKPFFVPLTNAQRGAGVQGYADGGPVHMQTGDFVFSKKALDKVGGLQALKAQGYPAKPIKGPGTGTSDSIPATIDGKEPARVANGEALIPQGAKMKGLKALHDKARKA